MDNTQDNVAGTEPKPFTVNPVYDAMVDPVETKFFFKKVTDDAGNETKRPTVEIKIPRPSVEGIKYVLEHADTPEGAKALELLLEAVGDVVIARARQILNEPQNEALTSESFPVGDLAWQTIANLPKSDRRESAIPKEAWDDFVKDYIAVMPAATNKPMAKVALAAKVFLKKFAVGDIKQNKTALSLLKGQLALYITSTPNAEAFMDVVDWLDKKAQQLIDAEPENIGDSL
jgi:hypothetical protein